MAWPGYRGSLEVGASLDGRDLAHRVEDVLPILVGDGLSVLCGLYGFAFHDAELRQPRWQFHISRHDCADHLASFRVANENCVLLVLQDGIDLPLHDAPRY